MTVWLAAISIALPSVFFDFRERRIPNALIVLGLLASVSAVIYEAGTAGLTNALLGGALVFLASFVFWLIGWLGAGDVKLIGVFGLLVGLPQALTLLINIGLFGAMLAVLFVLARGGAGASWKRLNMMLASRSFQLQEDEGNDNRVVRLPYAIAVVSGAFATMMGFSPIG